MSYYAFFFTRKHIHKCGFTTAVYTDQCRPFSGVKGKGYIFKDILLSPRVTKRDIAKGNFIALFFSASYRLMARLKAGSYLHVIKIVHQRFLVNTQGSQMRHRVGHTGNKLIYAIDIK